MKEWITGRNPVYEVLRARRRHVFRLLLGDTIERTGHINDIVQFAKERKLRAEVVTRSQLDSIDNNHQGLALQVSAYPQAALQDIIKLAEKRGEAPFILALDSVKDPQNLGTLLRTAEAVGVHGVLLPFKRTASVTPAVVNASSGASEHLLVTQVNLAQTLETLKEEGVWIVGLDGGPDSQPVSDIRLDGALAVVVGSESSGMRALTRKICDHVVRLPMRGQIDSLNASAAGSVVLYLALMARQKS
jgi:23S rRNA (guanosine2251-2'-O)-methyltransferase